MARKPITAADLPTKTYAALGSIGVMEDDTFIIKKAGQLVDLTDAEHAEMLALGKVSPDAIEQPAA
jgi:hypothetical protein